MIPFGWCRGTASALIAPDARTRYSVLVRQASLDGFDGAILPAGDAAATVGRGDRMKVIRIVPNIPAAMPSEAQRFYGDLFGLEIGMDHGWIMTFVGTGEAAPQISFASVGGAGTPVPDLSIEVDDVAEAHRRIVQAGYPVEYGPVTEPWGVRRFFVRDPFGRLVNILAHETK